MQWFTISFYFPQTIIEWTAAYKHADGKKIDGKRVLVDVERARTVKGWLPRRLGGGLGGTRRGGPEVNIKHSGREDNVREKERYRLEREKEDRRGGDDRRGDRKLNSSKMSQDFHYKNISQDSKENAQSPGKRAARVDHTRKKDGDVSHATKNSIVMKNAESRAIRTESGDDRDHAIGKLFNDFIKLIF